MAIFNFFNRPHPTGYWYAGRDEARALMPGMRLKNARSGPPWRVIDRQLSSTIVTAKSWPGRLWRARVIKMGDMSGLVAEPGYWRASEIELLEELPVGMLFGSHGDEIVALLEQISRLTPVQAAQLQAGLPEDAHRIWLRAWANWNSRLPFSRPEDNDDDSLTLGWPGHHDKNLSPVGRGFMLMYDAIWQRARETEGASAFEQYTEAGEAEEKMTPKWSAAAHALAYRAMAVAECEHLSGEEYARLSESWSAVFAVKTGA